MVSGNSQPRVIRRVTKWTGPARTRRPKVARDRKALIQMERIKAQSPKLCSYHDCPYPNVFGFSRGGAITVGTEYAMVTDRNGKGRRVGSKFFFDPKPYHFECVPPEARFLVRFFRGGFA